VQYIGHQRPPSAATAEIGLFDPAPMMSGGLCSLDDAIIVEEHHASVEDGGAVRSGRQCTPQGHRVADINAEAARQGREVVAVLGELAATGSGGRNHPTRWMTIPSWRARKR
jgi:hypothetical protein